MIEPKKIPLILAPAVIIPALVIGALGVYLISHQTTARLLDIKKEYSSRLTHSAAWLETRIRESIDSAFKQMESGSSSLQNTETIIAATKSTVMNRPVVKYPFFIDQHKTFLFPVSPQTISSKPRTLAFNEKLLNGKVKEYYEKASILEYGEKKYNDAIGFYLSALNLYTRDPGTRGAAPEPYITLSIARCYFKAGSYPQAITYYHRILDRLETDKKQDPLLYFTTLRQLALSYRRLENTEKTADYYLQLYEEASNHHSPEDATLLAFYRNEALDYLNRHIREKSKDNPNGDETGTIKRLKEKSELEIALQWQFYEIDLEEMAALKEKHTRNRYNSQFVKLKELYETSDERSLFYTRVKNSMTWNAPPSPTPHPAIKKIHPGIPGHSTSTFIAFKPIMKNPDGSTVYFGFMISFDFIQETHFPAAVKEYFESAYSRVGLTFDEKEKNRLLSVPFKSLFPGETLTLYAHKPGYFEAIVRRDTRWYYFLLAALFVTFSMGIFLFLIYLKREAELVRLKADFVDNASHTLKTPLTRISLLAENVKQGWVNSEIQRESYLNKIISETRWMTEMIDNMLNFSRIEAGKQQYRPTVLYLQESIAAITDGYSHYLHSLGFQLDVDIDDSLPALSLDPNAVKSIVINLLQNAVKYSLDEKYIRIRVNTEPGWVVLEISDHGIGIPPEAIPRLFEKFYRAGGDIVSAIEGSGLGLFLVKHAVEMHKGKIKVTSTVGQGTAVSVYFPHPQQSQGLSSSPHLPSYLSSTTSKSVRKRISGTFPKAVVSRK